MSVNKKMLEGREKLVEIGLVVLIGILVYSVLFSRKSCGGLMANLEKNQCPPGYVCHLSGSYPDASGTCRFAPILILREFF